MDLDHAKAPVNTKAFLVPAHALNATEQALL